MTVTPITASLVRELFNYNKRTGNLYWRNTFLAGQVSARMRPRPKAGDCVKIRKLKIGYAYISIFGNVCLVHRVIWLHQTGELPPRGKVIDHKDHNGFNNCWRNLRIATHAQNCCNQIRSPGKSGFLGVRWHAQRNNRWSASVQHEGKIYHKEFDDIADAIAWRDVKARTLHGKFAVYNRGV